MYEEQFKPSEQVTRSKIALMIYPAYEHKIEEKYIPSTEALYHDYEQSNQELMNAISMLYELGTATGPIIFRSRFTLEKLWDTRFFCGNT